MKHWFDADSIIKKLSIFTRLTKEGYNARFIRIGRAIATRSGLCFLITEEGKLLFVDVCLSNQKR